MIKVTTLIITALVFSNITFSQIPTDKIILSKNQKLITSTVLNGIMSMEMMGQNMETISESSVSSTMEVKNVTPTGYVLTNTVNKMKVKTKGGMTPPVDFDSEKNEDMKSEIGKTVKDKLQPKDMEITFAGKAVENKNSKDEDEMAKAMQSVMNGTGENGITDVFMMIPTGKKPGDIWLDSSNANGIKTHNTYTLKKINGNEATIGISTISNINKTINSPAGELIIDMDSRISSENIVDLSTGIIKEKRTTVEGKGNLGAGGQEMPMTTKVTSVTTVKNM